MAIDREQMHLLRKRITEGLRIQRDSGDAVPYIDVSNVLGDVSARQNHAIFARRGCGKTLLLHNSAKHVDESVRSVYLNCEDFKRHSFPNVLIEILDALFGELEVHLSGWFGKKKKVARAYPRYTQRPTAPARIRGHPAQSCSGGQSRRR